MRWRVRSERWRKYIKHKGWETRCEHCEHRFLPSHSRNSFGDNRATYHDVCIGYVMWRGRAEERLEVLDLVSDIWQIDAATVEDIAGGRKPDGWKSSNARNLVWRAFNDLKNYREAHHQAKEKAQ